MPSAEALKFECTFGGDTTFGSESVGMNLFQFLTFFMLCVAVGMFFWKMSRRVTFGGLPPSGTGANVPIPIAAKSNDYWFLESKDEESKTVSELLESELYKHLPYPDQMPGIEEVLVSASLSRGKAKRFHIYPECPALKRCISVMPPLQACQLLSLIHI